MRVRALYLGLVILMLIAYVGENRADLQDQHADCKLVAAALQAANALQTGTRRGDLEREFELDGGISATHKGTYVYRKCRYIKLDVEFMPVDRGERPLASSRDEIKSRTRPYLAFPVMD